METQEIKTFSRLASMLGALKLAVSDLECSIDQGEVELGNVADELYSEDEIVRFVEDRLHMWEDDLAVSWYDGTFDEDDLTRPDRDAWCKGFCAAQRECLEDLIDFINGGALAHYAGMNPLLDALSERRRIEGLLR